MSFKKILPLAAAFALTIGSNVASAEITSNVALTSDYKFRGISQSDESPAIQGGLDYAHDSGFYVGTWASSVDFDTNGAGYDGSLELDVYAGFGNTIGDSDFGYDVGVMYYAYPGDDGAEGDYFEVYGGLSWKDLSLSVAYSDDYYAETGKFYYVAGDYSFSFAETWTLDLHAGYNSFDEEGFLSDGADQYWDYSVGVGVSLPGLDLSLAYVGTDLDEEEVFGSKWGDAQAIFSISKSM
tara:strand:- start:1472 stop:2188 length:717 start_codon:yes stop_codon:yes gene_type:complete